MASQYLLVNRYPVMKGQEKAIQYFAAKKVEEESQKRSFYLSLTSAVHQTLGCPLDKISISIQEISPSRWSDAGVIENDPEFATKSRLIAVKDAHNETNEL